jgi:hypothetical protein
MKELTIIFLILLVFACQSKKSAPGNTTEAVTDSEIVNIDIISIEPKDLYEESFRIENYLTTDTPEDEEITLITEDCCVFISPDSTQIVTLKGNTIEDQENFYTIADDNNYYDYEASKFLDSIKLKRIYPKTRYLKFVMSDGSLLVDTRSKISRGWITILFDVDKKPKIINPVDIEMIYNDFIKE